jgi:hypothetical protein
MTKGQELAELYAMPGFGTDCAAAIDAAVSKRTVECAELPIPFVGDRHCPHYIEGFEAGLRQYRSALLALNTPASAYPFGKDATGRQCACWEQNDRLWWNKDGDYPHDLDAHYTHCPFCGAPRTKGI